MTKSPDAFRTISEVAEWLDRPTHVLRFWESKFTQVKPIKRAGGRRYYRPEDMLLLGGIKKLLHDDGMTIKGVQKMLREQGVAHVAELSQPLDVMAEPDEMVPSPQKVAELKEQAEPPESATLLRFRRPADADQAEAELATSSFEAASEDLAPNAPSEDQPEAAPTPDVQPAEPSEPVAEAKPNADFEAPSFFNMFDAMDPEKAEEPPTATDDAPAVDSDAQDVSPAPRIVEVEVDARSTKGAGVLSKLRAAAPKLSAARPAELVTVRENLRALVDRMQTS
jgi:DNA-binding transcriptional MerR regulator